MQHSICVAWTWGNSDEDTNGVCELHQALSTDVRVSSSPAVLRSQRHTSGIVSFKRSVLFVHHHPPQQRLGSDRRLLALLGQVQKLGWRVSYAGANDDDPGPIRGRTLLGRMKIPLLSPVRGGEALANFARTHSASVIVLGLWFWGGETIPARYMRSLRLRLPRVKLVVMTDDVHHLRLKLAADDEGQPAGSVVSRTLDEEMRWYFLADHVLTISSQDKRAIAAAVTQDRAMHEDRFSVMRHVYADDVLFPLHRLRPFASRSGLLFVGNLNNPTNLFGLRWFMDRVWPLVRKLAPQMTLRVVGDVGGDYVVGSGLAELLRSCPGVEVTGYLPDEQLGETLQSARLLIVPIRWATGILTKQTLAHVHGLPTVITPTGAKHIAPAPLDADGYGEACSHEHGKYVPVRVAKIAEDPQTFAAAVLNAYQNETLWSDLSRSAAQFARSGGGGQGVCPTGIADDWLSFWAKLQRGICGNAQHFTL
jgi:glycosyltransferase involved in cell wall biosynthesis